MVKTPIMASQSWCGVTHPLLVQNPPVGSRRPPHSPVSSHRKPKTKRSKRFLESRAPKLVEDVKTAMIMKGGNTSLTITQALKDIVSGLPAAQRASKQASSQSAPCFVSRGFLSRCSSP